MQNFGVSNKEHYGMLWYSLEWSIQRRPCWCPVVAYEQALLFGQAKRASRERASEGPSLLSSAPRGFAARSRVLARLVSLAQIGELARRLILWELNSFLMQTPSFVPINLHRCWPREWKRSIKDEILKNVSCLNYPNLWHSNWMFT